MLAIQNSELDPRVRMYVRPERVVWHSDGASAPERMESLLKTTMRQSTVQRSDGCILRHNGSASGLLLDFGRELFGGVQIIAHRTRENQAMRLRIRFGESVSEAMGGPNMDHAIHDTILHVPWAGTAEIGNTGFRFVRIDTLDEGSWVEILAVRAVLLYRDLEYKGAFECSDERLNRIWRAGAYTVQLNMQGYVWDGVKRDQLVWVGDLNPETMVISSVFGEVDVLPRSLDFARDEAPLPHFMNGIFSYSLWWIICHRDWYLYHGNKAYLEEQKPYLLELLRLLDTYTEANLPEGFLDWPSSPYKDAVRSGLYALFVMAMQAGRQLCEALQEPAAAARCEAAASRWLKSTPSHYGVKTAAALMALAGMIPAQQANDEILAADPLKGVSTFYGYYVLQARALAGDYTGCLDVIRRFWGAMLDFGATTFWEDFNLDWTRNAGRIDELVQEGKDDLHADFGDYCYKGLRHSLCHGWAGGPTAWLSEHVLGFQPLLPGCSVLAVSPHLGDLEWARGAFPTPHGVVRVSHTKTVSGVVSTTVDAPDGVHVILNAPNASLPSSASAAPCSSNKWQADSTRGVFFFPN